MRLDEKSQTACALTAWRDRLQLSWADRSGQVHLTSSSDGREFAVPQRLPYHTYRYDKSSMDDSFSDWVVTAPVLAGAPERLFLAWSGDGAAVTLLVGDHRAFFAPTVFQHRTRLGPAVSLSRDGMPVLAWVGSDWRVNVHPLQENAATKPIRLAAAKTLRAPALCAHQGALVLAWTGTDRRVNLLTLDENGPGAHVRLNGARTNSGPAVCSHQGAVLLAWTGADRRVNLLTVADNRAPIRLEEARSNFAPAVCSHRGRLTLAWVGSDTHLNVTQPAM